jgi:hypothetical protein
MAREENNMTTIEMTTYYDIPLHCPFCGKSATVYDGNGLEVEGCNHLHLLTTSDFIIHMSEAAEKIIVDAGYDIVREEGDVMVTNPNDDDDHPNIIALMSKFPDAVIFEQVVGPPSLEISHTVFAFNDDDYAKFGESL